VNEDRKEQNEKGVERKQNEHQLFSDLVQPPRRSILFVPLQRRLSRIKIILQLPFLLVPQPVCHRLASDDCHGPFPFRLHLLRQTSPFPLRFPQPFSEVLLGILVDRKGGGGSTRKSVGGGGKGERLDGNALRAEAVLDRMLLLVEIMLVLSVLGGILEGWVGRRLVGGWESMRVGVVLLSLLLLLLRSRSESERRRLLLGKLGSVLGRRGRVVLVAVGRTEVESVEARRRRKQREREDERHFESAVCRLCRERRRGERGWDSKKGKSREGSERWWFEVRRFEYRLFWLSS